MGKLTISTGPLSITILNITKGYIDGFPHDFPFLPWDKSFGIDRGMINEWCIHFWCGMRDNLLDSGFIPQFWSKSISLEICQETPEVAKTTAMERAPEAGDRVMPFLGLGRSSDWRKVRWAMSTGTGGPPGELKWPGDFLDKLEGLDRVDYRLNQ